MRQVIVVRILYPRAADPSAKQSYSRITDDQPNRASHAISDGSPMRNGDGEGDDARRSSVCKWKDSL